MIKKSSSSLPGMLLLSAGAIDVGVGDFSRGLACTRFGRHLSATIEHSIISDKSIVRADASTNSVQGTSVRGEVSNHNGCIAAYSLYGLYPSIRLAHLTCLELGEWSG